MPGRSIYLINFLMVGVRHKKYHSDPANIIQNSNNNNNLVWLKMGKWVTNCSIEAFKLAKVLLDFC